MRLKELLKGIENAEIYGDSDIEISGVACDSRKVCGGSVFVCVKGFAADGHKFVDSALKNGAAAIVCEEKVEVPDGITVIKIKDSRIALAVISANFYGNPAKKMKIVGVTGTNGKTTTTTLIKSILEFNGKTVGLIGTNENVIKDKVIPTERTTPESIELQELFAKMADEGVEYVVMEVSSHSLFLNRVYGIEFEAGVFTNLTQDHLDFHETMENYLKAKQILFNMSKKGVVNIDDEKGETIIKEAKCPCMSYSAEKEADLCAKDIGISARGVRFTACYEGKSFSARLSIPGKFSVYNALSAIGACLSLGLSMENTLDGLLIAKGVKGRAETVYTGKNYNIIIDYAHSPDGLLNIISTVKGFAEGRVITVFGCGGDRDATKRPVMGEIAGRLSDLCVVTSDNPRTEEPMSIIRQIEEGVKKTDVLYAVIENRKEAIKYAMDNAQKGDCIILAGKGHETYQIIGKEKRHFDEREVIRDILSK